ncbi:UDP-N-acetylmuramate dehydrogenase [bacterium]|nr:UDP-N-acetylmuramate dehydrogenase [bacterium]
MDTSVSSFRRHFLERVGKPLKTSVSLKNYSHFRIGGKAEGFFEAHSVKDLTQGVEVARKHSFPYFIIGGGFNILFDDKGFRGLIIKNAVSGIKAKDKVVECWSGTFLEELIHFCKERGLAGLEFFAGIPGTVGGAVCSNAGAFGKEVGNYVQKASLLDREGKKFEVGREYFSFGYRQSGIQKTLDIVLNVSFGLDKGSSVDIKKRMDEILQEREKKHPPKHIACAGSYFKNPVLSSGEKVPAAELLEKVGAKKLEVGGASVHPSHANFIFNRRNASSGDVLQLASELKRRVREKFGVELEEEVTYLPEKISGSSPGRE